MIELLRAGQDSDELEYILLQRLNSPEAVPRRGGRRGAELLRRGSGETDFNVWSPAYDVLEGDGRIVSSA